MSLTLHYHPLASYCWKPLIALYEYGTSFKPLLVDLGNPESFEAFLKLWPMGEFPVLQDEGRRQLIPQSAAIIEYLTLYEAKGPGMIPSDPTLALEVRRWDSFLDGYVHNPMQKIVADVLRPQDKRDPLGVAEAHDTLQSAYGVLEKHLAGKRWFVGDAFTMADCSAAPALFYGEKVEPFSKSNPVLAAYFERLRARPSFARVLKDAEPFLHLFPYKSRDQHKS